MGTNTPNNTPPVNHIEQQNINPNQKFEQSWVNDVITTLKGKLMSFKDIYNFIKEKGNSGVEYLSKQFGLLQKFGKDLWLESIKPSLTNQNTLTRDTHEIKDNPEKKSMSVLGAANWWFAKVMAERKNMLDNI
jgi:hypothetical protein